MYTGYLWLVDICVFTFSSNDILDGHNIIIYTLITTNAEMSRPKQLHVSRPKRSDFLIMMLMPLFLNLVYVWS